MEDKQQQVKVLQKDGSVSSTPSSKPFSTFITQRKFTFLFIFLFLVMVVSVGSKFYKPQSKQQQPLVMKKTIIKQSLVKRSMDLKLVSRGLTGKAVDVTTGKIVQAARIFSPADNAVYLEVDLANAPKGTVIDVLRYKLGRYVSHDEITVPASNTENVLFSWKINVLLNKVREGNWKAVTYANGILAKRFSYVISGSGKISYVSPDEPISPTDFEYHLKNVLAARERY